MVSFSDVDPDLRPVVRPPSATRPSSADGPAAPGPVVRPLAPMLSETISIGVGPDAPVIRRANLDGWGVPAAAVVNAAHRNLLGSDVQVRWSKAVPGAAGVVTEDSDRSAWLALPAALAGVADRVEVPDRVSGRALVLSPRSNLVLLVGAGDPGRIDEALAWALEKWEADDDDGTAPVSPVPYAATIRGLAEWRPREDHANHLAAKRAREKLAFQEYGAQKEELARRLAGSGGGESLAEHAYLGNYMVLETPDGGLESACTWVENVSFGFLPKTDLVAIWDGEGGLAKVPWEHVVRLAEPWLQREKGLDPPRWRIDGRPSDEVLAQLRALAR